MYHLAFIRAFMCYKMKYCVPCWFLLIVTVKQAYFSSMLRRINCINGTIDQQCANGGTCRTRQRQDVSFAKGKITKYPKKNFTYCACSRQWGGITCKEKNTCFYERPCEPGHYANCRHVSPDSFKCICTLLWTGQRCESPRNISLQRVIEKNPCRSNPCGAVRGKKAKGICLIVYGSKGEYIGYTCKCDERHTGVHCETLRDCRHVNDDCKNGGSCFRPLRSKTHTCKCPPLFTGFRCEYLASNNESQLEWDIPPPKQKKPRLSSKSGSCSSNPCRRGSTCHELRTEIKSVTSISKTGSFHCECPWDFISSCTLPSNAELEAFEKEIQSCLMNVGNLQGYLDIFGFDENPFPRHENVTFRKSRSVDKRNPCLNNAICIVQMNNVRCFCPVGVKGKLCSVHSGPEVKMKLEFANEFRKSLLDNSSNEVLTLQHYTKHWVSRTCAEDLGEVCHVTDVRFSPGSILATYNVLFSSKLTRKKKIIAGKLRRSLMKNSQFFPDKTLMVDPRSILVTEVSAPQRLKRRRQDWKAVYYAVIASVVFSLLVITASVFLLYRAMWHRASNNLSATKYSSFSVTAKNQLETRK